MRRLCRRIVRIERLAVQIDRGAQRKKSLWLQGGHFPPLTAIGHTE